MLTTRNDAPGRNHPAAEGNLKSLTGWGGAPSSTSEVMEPGTTTELAGILAPGRTLIPRGLGRSYGDAAQLAGGTVVDMTGITGVWLDAETGMVTTGAGTSLGRLIDTVLPSGWFLPVTPGTRHVTVGGAIAADVHGKNHHRHGSFSQHVSSLEMVTGDGDTLVATPGDDAFSATVGGMGLTGLITRATFQLIPVESAWMRVDTFKGTDLDAVMQILAMADEHYTYSVAWVDLTEPGRGRGVVTAAEHARHDEARDEHSLPSGPTAAPSPPTWLPRVVTQRTVGAFNKAWFWKAPSSETGRLEPLESYFYPLDRIPHWNRLYGSRGFLQYQLVVPDGAEDTLTRVAAALTHTDTPVALAVLKRMGPSRRGLLSFPMPGWTLAVDMPLGDPQLASLLDEWDRIIASCGGRVYFAKDSRLKANVGQAMYPDLERWRALRSRLDPEGHFSSDLSRRLALCG